LLPLKTLYLGGGTPSLLSAASVEKLLGIFQMGGVEISSDAELTMECNPESLTEDKVRDLKSLGINRISLGVQSF